MSTFPRTVYVPNKYIAKVKAFTVHGTITRDELRAIGTMYLGFRQGDVFYRLKPKGYSTDNILNVESCHDTLDAAQAEITERIEREIAAAEKALKKAKADLAKWNKKIAPPAERCPCHEGDNDGR